MRTLFALALSGIFASGCVVETHDHHHDVVVPDDGCYGSSPGPAIEVPIDPAEHIDTAAGQGAGVFVEYASGGHWHVFTACDSEGSGWSCSWDLVLDVSPAEVTGLSGEDLESSDDTFTESAEQARFLASTDYDFDGLWLDTDPGATLRLDALLDCKSAEAYVYWVSGGGIHRGAPSNPIDLTPTEP